MKNFALIGVGGYIASRHLQAIKATGNQLVAALDKHDSVGIIDSYFPDADFFTEFERFDRHIDKRKHTDDQHVDYVSICSPNYLHDAHVRFALRIGAEAICEKPLVLNPWNIDALQQLEDETGGRVSTILQLRLHPSLIALKEKIDNGPSDKIYDVDLSYITSRGHWYSVSWKGDIAKSGGVATNIGVHFFDMLTWIFGSVKQNIVQLREERKVGGYMELEKARVRWFLSVDREDLPFVPKPGKPMTYRSITVDGDELEFSGGFTDLHTVSYKHILTGNGFRLKDVRPSIEIVSNIRKIEPVGLKGDYHPLIKKNS